MARRAGRKGDYLATDDYYGTTIYGSQLRRDFWGSYTRKPLLRNLQEIATPLSDPEPVTVYRGPAYEQLPPGRTCIGENIPPFIGVTNIPTNINNAAVQGLNLKPGVGSMSVGCSLVVY